MKGTIKKPLPSIKYPEEEMDHREGLGRDEDVAK
jgi:hypothetical protein